MISRYLFLLRVFKIRYRLCVLDLAWYLPEIDIQQLDSYNLNPKQNLPGGRSEDTSETVEIIHHPPDCRRSNFQHELSSKSTRGLLVVAGGVVSELKMAIS